MIAGIAVGTVVVIVSIVGLVILRGRGAESDNLASESEEAVTESHEPGTALRETDAGSYENALDHSRRPTQVDGGE
jgi:hypothetical protein